MGASVLALVAAAIVAAGFAALANLVLNRRPASLAEWNESFLAGLGMVAAIAIPLSLLGWPSLRFAILIGLLLVVVLRRSDFTASRPRTPSGTLGARIAATMAVAPGVVLFAVANARDEVKRDAHYVTPHCGGDGALRDAIEYILKAQGKWKGVLKSYVGERGE